MSEQVGNRDLVGAVVLYDTPDALAQGIGRAREAGFRHIDAVSPYPIHGIDHLLDRPASKLGIVALIAGLIGTAVAKSFQWWVSAVDYPLNIAGKPLFSWPGLIPVTFELMVLFTAITTVVGMIFLFNRLPEYNSALLESKYMPNLASDKFGLVIAAKDPIFDGETIGSVLGGEGTLGFDLLYTEPAEPSDRIVHPWFVAVLVVVALVAIVKTRTIVKYTGELPPWNMMKEQPRLDAQSLHTVFSDSLGMRPPVEGTIARGHIPYRFIGDPDGAASNLVNPVPLTTSSLERGREKFDTFCRPCHGVRADGRMTLTSAFPKPPTLHSNKVREWTDGQMFHVITTGQNAMPQYASQIGVDDRWRIIHYVRTLQRSRSAPERDVK
jgi:hypothetical protein